MRSLLLSCLAVLACGTLPAAEPPPEPKPVDLKALPANQWVERALSLGEVASPSGFCGADPRGVLVFQGVTFNKTGHVVDNKTFRIGRLDLAAGACVDVFSGPLEPPAPGDPAHCIETLSGLQLCFDSDRKTLVALTGSGLAGRGRTVEFDLEAKKAAGHKPDPSPPVVTAASLAYDPVNKEVVLATGGFSPVGGTDGTWLYDGAKKQWRRLETPKEMDEVRLPLDKARDRLIALRWLAWKNLEFRATGREKLLDERSKGEVLAKEAAELAAEFKKLGELAATNSAKAERPYHKNGLAAAGKLLGEAVGKLGGSDAKLKSGSPEELEVLYRGNLVPALEAVEKAVSELAVTPEPRMSSRLVYDSKNKLIVCFGGEGQRRDWADTWVYHCEGRWWERRHPKAQPSPRNSRAMAYDGRNGVIVLVHSTRWGRPPQETWCYDAARDEWRRLALPASQSAGFLEYDAGSGCLVALSEDLAKSWLLRLDLATAKLIEVQPVAAASIVLPPPTGADVLRDAATVAELTKYKAEMDEWVKGVAANTWVAVPTRGTGRPNGGRTWSSIVYDPDRWQIYYRDGGHGSYHGADTDHYDLPTGRWFRSDWRDYPPWPMGSYFGWGRSFSLAPWAVHTYKYGLFYNPLTKRLNRTIGQSGGMEGTGAGSLLDYDPDTGRWSRGFYQVADLKDSQWVVPGTPDRLIKVSPWTRYNPKSTTSVWQRTTDGEKTWPNTGPLPYGHDDAGTCFFFDPKRNRAMFYGGANKELHALDFSVGEPKWRKLPMTGEGGKLPSPGREIVYVPKHDLFLMIEAKDGPVPLWSLTPGDNVWCPVRSAGAPAMGAAICIGLQYDPVTDLCLFKEVDKPMLAFRYAPERKP